MLFNYVHQEDQEFVKKSFKTLQPDVFKSNTEFRIQLPERKEYWLRLSLLINHQEQKERMLAGYAEDITAYKAHNDKLNEFANKKNSILNILSHDLAGPLGSIQNLSAFVIQKNKFAGGPGSEKMAFFN